MSGYLVFVVTATLVIGANAFASYTVGGSEFYDTNNRFRTRIANMLDEIESNLKRGCDEAGLYLARSAIDVELRSLNVIIAAKENTGYQALQRIKETKPELLARIRAWKAQGSGAVPPCTDPAGR